MLYKILESEKLKMNKILKVYSLKELQNEI
jgi:hypothetical protein